MKMKNEHKHYAAVAIAKTAAIEATQNCVTWGDLLDATREITAPFGKLARHNIRAAAATARNITPPDTPGLTKSKHGTWAAVRKGNRAYPLTQKQCQDQGLEPGPGNL